MMSIEKFIRASDIAIINYLGRRNPSITDNENYFYFNRGSALTVVAHLDTVRKAGKVELINDNGVLSNKNGILGADDRAGIFLLSKAFKMDCNILVTNYEETGGKGVSKFVKDYPEACSGTKFFIELDRQGIDNYVTYTELPTSYKLILETLDFKEEYGSFSDITILSGHYLVPSINIGVGYYNQHTAKEYLDLQDLARAGRNLKLLLRTKWQHEKITKALDYDSYGYEFDDSYGYEFDDVLYDELDLYGITDDFQKIKDKIINSDKLRRLIESEILNLVT